VEFQPLDFVIVQNSGNFIGGWSCFDKQVVFDEQRAFEQSDFYRFPVAEKCG
jgi:hypothetical protein